MGMVSPQLMHNRHAPRRMNIECNQKLDEAPDWKTFLHAFLTLPARVTPVTQAFLSTVMQPHRMDRNKVAPFGKSYSGWRWKLFFLHKAKTHALDGDHANSGNFKNVLTKWKRYRSGLSLPFSLCGELAFERVRNLLRAMKTMRKSIFCSGQLCNCNFCRNHFYHATNQLHSIGIRYCRCWTLQFA